MTLFGFITIFSGAIKCNETRPQTKCTIVSVQVYEKVRRESDIFTFYISAFSRRVYPKQLTRG